MLENLAHSRGFPALQVRIFLQPRQGFLARFDQQTCVANEIGQAKIREARLARAEQFAWTTQLEIGFGDLEAVGVLFPSRASARWRLRYPRHD